MYYRQNNYPRNYRGRNYRVTNRYSVRHAAPASEQQEEKEKVNYPNLPYFVQNMPAHIVKLIRILQSNADIRRYTALGIINRLVKQGEITEDGNYVRFRWDKFTVCSKGINKDYRYDDMNFLNAFVSAFSIISNVATAALKNFCQNEESLKGTVINDDENIANEIIEHQMSNDNPGEFEDK